MKIVNTNPFSERILLFGGGGVGKTNTVLSVAAGIAEGEMHVVESDYSLAYDRALATDFAEAADRVHVYAATPDWQDFLSRVQEAVTAANPECDWLVIDPVSSSWDWVQEWALDAQYGMDLVQMLVDLKKQYGTDSKGYGAALSEMMNWNLVKKEYAKLYRAIQRWKGHLILTAEAKATGNREKDDETKMLYGPLGFKPAGEGRLKHIASTTLFLDHPKRGQWRMTTIKDRNREEMERETIDNFAIDYLVARAGWEPERFRKEA